MSDMEPCEACGGPLVYLGLLGTVAHFRCRNCGLDARAFEPTPEELAAATTPAPEPEPEPDDDDDPAGLYSRRPDDEEWKD